MFTIPLRFHLRLIYDFIYALSTIRKTTASPWPTRGARQRGRQATVVNEIVSGIPLVGWDFPDTISFTVSFTSRAGRPAPKRPRRPEKGPRPASGRASPARFVNEIVNGIPLVGWDFPDTISFTNRAGRPAPGEAPATRKGAEACLGAGLPSPIRK